MWRDKAEKKRQEVPGSLHHGSSPAMERRRSRLCLYFEGTNRICWWIWHMKYCQIFNYWDIVGVNSYFAQFPFINSTALGDTNHLMPGASTRGPTHDKVMREKTWQAGQIRFSGALKRPAHEIPPMTRSRGENLTGKEDQVFRDFEKLPLALTLKMISVFLTLASIDYFLISVKQAEGLPRPLYK